MQKCYSAVRLPQMISIFCATYLLLACAGGDDSNNPTQSDSAAIAGASTSALVSEQPPNLSNSLTKSAPASNAAADEGAAPVTTNSSGASADSAQTPLAETVAVSSVAALDTTTLKTAQSNKRTNPPSTTTPAGNSSTSPPPKQAVAASQALVAAPAGGLSVLDPKFKRLYGPGVYVMDALADLSIGVVKGYNYIAAHRFRATASGKANALQVYWPSGTGYAAGNGGKISIRILPDDGSSEHLPNMNAQPLSTATYEPGLILGRHIFSSYNDVVRLGSLTSLVSGQLYHVVYENLASDPAANYIGINNVVTVERNGRPARWLDPTDWSSLFGFRAVNTKDAFTWKDAGRSPNSGLYYAPILQITLDSGALIGAVDIEAGNVEGSRQWSIEAGRPIREQFTPTATRVVSGFSVSTAAASPGELEWSIRQGDVVLHSGVISEAAANYASQFNTNLTQGVFKWYDIALPANLTLEARRSYELTFTAKGSSQWRFADEYNGADKGYAIAFAESQAQVLVSGKWLNANHRSQTSQGPSSNWRVVLHLAP